MTERHWTDELSDYLNGDLPQAERLAVEAHLSGCVECRAVLDDLKAVIARASDLQESPPESDLWVGIAQAIECPALILLNICTRARMMNLQMLVDW